MQNQVKKQENSSNLTQVKTELKKKFELFEGQLRNVLPNHIKAETMISLALTAWGKTPGLQKCTIPSILMSTYEASILGLKPESFTGECYFVPYGNKCQLIPGYRGLIQLAYRTGKVKEIYAETVYVQDKFEYQLGLDRKLTHEPSPDRTYNDNDIVAFYSVIKYTNGGSDFTVMVKKEVDRIMAKSKSASGSDSPWKLYYARMGEKTAFRKLLKTAQLSSEVQRAVGLDETHEAGKDQGLTEEIDFELLHDDLKPEFEKEKQGDVQQQEAEKAANARKKNNERANQTL